MQIKIPTVLLSQEDIDKIYESIHKTEEKATTRLLSIDSSSLIRAIDIKIGYTITIGKSKKLVKTILLGGQLYSKSKNYSTVGTLLTLNFYKNRKLKSFSVARASFSNLQCYKGFDPSKVIYYD